MKVLKDDEEVVITGKELAKHRDICRKEGVIEQKEKDKIIFVHVEKVKNKERVRIVFADETIQFFDL